MFRDVSLILAQVFPFNFRGFEKGLQGQPVPNVQLNCARIVPYILIVKSR